MNIKMVCPICEEEFEVKNITELVVEDMYIESVEFHCPECGKEFYIGG